MNRREFIERAESLTGVRIQPTTARYAMKIGEVDPVTEFQIDGFGIYTERQVLQLAEYINRRRHRRRGYKLKTSKAVA